MNIPIVIGIDADSAHRAEATLDWIYQLAGRVKSGAAMVCFDADCSPEQRAKIKLTADLAFESVQELLVPPVPEPARSSPINRRNAVFIAAAEQCQKSFRVPWLWIEPDCTPTNPKWLANIAAEYEAQPYRYLGVHLKPTEDSQERFLLRVAVYHMGCFNDIAKLCADRPGVPFENAAGMNLVVRSSKTRAFQPLRIQDEADFKKVWPEAQIVCGDAAGALIEYYREQGIHIPKQRKRNTP